MRRTSALILGSAAIALAACASPEPNKSVSVASAAPPAANEFRRVVSPKGTQHIVSISRDAWRDPPRADSMETAAADDRPPGMRMATLAAAAPHSNLCSAKPATSDGHTFFGSAREVAKTTVPSAPVETFTSVVALRADIAKKSDDLVMIDQGVSTKCDEVRSAPERRMVSVVGFLYAMKREDDNDYHLILGTKTCKQPGCFMTAEVSGVPRLPANRQEIAAARKQFETQIKQYADDGSSAGSGGYFRFDPPIPVQVTGPLFYDADHQVKPNTHAGAVGPSFARPSTSWEIHPVTNIDLNPDKDEVPISELP